MTDDELRQACEKHVHLYQARIDKDGWSDDLLTDVLMAFAKRMQAKKVRELLKRYNEYHNTRTFELLCKAEAARLEGA